MVRSGPSAPAPANGPTRRLIGGARGSSGRCCGLPSFRRPRSAARRRNAAPARPPPAKHRSQAKLRALLGGAGAASRGVLRSPVAASSSSRCRCWNAAWGLGRKHRGSARATEVLASPPGRVLDVVAEPADGGDEGDSGAVAGDSFGAANGRTARSLAGHGAGALLSGHDRISLAREARQGRESRAHLLDQPCTGEPASAGRPSPPTTVIPVEEFRKFGCPLLREDPVRDRKSVV